MPHKYVSSEFMEKDFPFWIKRFRHDSDRIPHTHEFVELVYVQEGWATHEFEGESYVIGPGDVFIINPGEMHTYRIRKGEPLDIINCLFTPALIRESLLHELELASAMDFLYVLPFLDEQERFYHRLRLGKQESATVLTILQSMVEETERAAAGYRSLITIKLVELLILLSRYYKEQLQQSAIQVDPDDMRVRRIRGYLERHAYQPVQVEAIASLFHIGSRHLNRILKKETGRSVVEIVHHLRLEKAKHLLLSTNDTILSIAASVGYESPSFFNRLFTREVGCSPSEYRKREKPDKY